MLVKNYMTQHAITIAEDSDYKQAFELMKEHQFHHLPVVNSAGEVVGIATYRDLQLAARCHLDTPTELREVMHTPVLTAMATDTLQNATKLMTDNKLGCLPIVDEEGHVTGMLTDTDLFRALSDLLSRHVEETAV